MVPGPGTGAVIIQRRIEDLIKLSIEHLSERVSVFRDSGLLADMVKRARGSTVNFDDLRALVDRDEELIRSGDRLATVESLQWNGKSSSLQKKAEPLASPRSQS